MKKVFLFVLIYIFLFFGRLFSLKKTNYPPGTFVEIVSTLDNEPEILGQTQRFSLAGFKIKTRRFPEYHYGDVLKIRGKVGPYHTISFPIIIKLNKAGESGLFSLLFHFRQRWEDLINQNLPFPQSSLLVGMLLGIKNLPYSLSSDLKRSGLIHLVVASGSNVSLVAAYPLYLSPILGRKTALILSLLAIFLYTLLIGFQPPIIRASIMGGLSYLAALFGRQSLSLLTLTLSAALMLLFNPFYLCDLSFQLSFLATLGIILFAPIFLSFLKKLNRGVSTAIATTISAQLFVLPLIVSKFGQFPLFSLLTNILVYPIVDPVMILGFPFVFLGVLSQFFSKIFSFFLYFPLTYFFLIAHYFGNPLFTLRIPKIPFPFFLPYYLFLLLLWQFFRKLFQKKVNIQTHERGPRC